MSYFELPVTIECPWCNDFTHDAAEFNMDEADSCGVKSRLIQSFCSECNKDFYFKAECRFETQEIFTSKKKPRGKHEEN